MKLLHLILLSLLVLSVQASAQNFLKNPGFEDWGIDGLPSYWSTSLGECQKSTVTHSGSGAVKLTNSSLFGIPMMGGLRQDSIPVSGTSFSLKGWYQFHPQGGDGLEIYIWINGPNPVLGETLVGANVLDITEAKSVWTAFSLGADMVTEATGDTASVWFWTVPDTASDSWHAGTYVLIDDIVLDNSVTGVDSREFATPSSFSLAQNYPNPFNPTTQIEFTVAKRSHVTLRIYNIMGQEVRTLVDREFQPGRYKADFDASGLPSGTYLYRIQAGNYSKTNKMLLLK